MELKKILLIDDDAAVNFLSKMTLTENNINCQVDVASDGSQAIDYLSATDCPDVILLDINMPVMDGLEFLQQYASQEKCCDRTQVYMLTSSDNAKDKTTCMQYNFVKGYFEKPLDAAHVNEVLEAVARVKG